MTRKRRKGIDRGTGPPSMKTFGGKLFSLWNFHKDRVKAESEAYLLRFMNYARIVPYKYPSGTKVYAVYARKKIEGGF